MRIHQKSDDKLLQVSQTMFTYINGIGELQNEVTKWLLDDFGNSPIDSQSIGIFAKITTKLINELSASQIRRFPTLLETCYDIWQRKFPTVCNKSKAEKKKVAMVAARLTFCYFYNGDIYKALNCLKDYVDLVPEDDSAKEIILKWFIYLNETELAEDFIEKKSMHKVNEQMTKFSQLFIKYTKSKECRSETLKELIEMNAQIKEAGQREKSFAAYDLISFSSCIVAMLSNIQLTQKLIMTVFPDRSTHLLDAVNKAEAIVRNRIPGLAPYEFNNAAEANIAGYFAAKKDISPRDYVHMGSSIAWMGELRREWAYHNVSTAQSRDAVSAFILNWRCALRLASFPRIAQSINGLYYYWYVIGEPDASDFLKIVDNACCNLLGPGDVIRCSTPMEKLSCIRSQTDETISIKDDDIKSQIVHNVENKCNCITCALYLTNYSFACEYLLAKSLNDGFTQKCMSFVDSEFVNIRSRTMKSQVSLFGKTIRPRPPVLLNEIFGMCVTRCLANKFDKKEKLQDFEKTIVRNCLKAQRYVPMRTLEYMLTIGQYERQLRSMAARSYSWIKEYERKPMVRIGIECAVDIIRAVSPFGRRVANEKKADRVKREVCRAKMKEASARMRQELMSFNHILYREWRSLVFPFTARITADPWEAALCWVESTSLGARNSIQQKLGKCQNGLVTISGAQRFERCVQDMPKEMTIVQIVIADNGIVYIVKLHCDRDPFIYPVAHCSQTSEMMEKFTHLLLQDERIAKSPGNRTAEQFWDTRKGIDARIKSLLQEIESNCLDVAAHLLVPSMVVGEEASTAAGRVEVLTKSYIKRGEAKELVALAGRMNEADWKKLVLNYCESRLLDEDLSQKLALFYKIFKQAMENDGVQAKNQKNYTYLAICPSLSQFCWEKLPVLEGYPYVCRIISIHALLCQLEELGRQEKRIPLEVDVQKAYYVLDPEDNLGATKKRMLDYITKFSWEGTVGAPPNANKITSALQEMDAFFYLGHGSGSRHMSRQAIKQSKCRAICLLMGCGSVRTVPQGVGFDGKSVLLDYAMANCPLVVGCLWTVTDGEIDRYLIRMVDDCFVRKCDVTGIEKLRDLSEAMEAARVQAKLKYLTGASVVMYGLPVVAKPEEGCENEVISAMNDMAIAENDLNFKTPSQSTRSLTRVMMPKNDDVRPKRASIRTPKKRVI